MRSSELIEDPVLEDKLPMHSELLAMCRPSSDGGVFQNLHQVRFPPTVRWAYPVEHASYLSVNARTVTSPMRRSQAADPYAHDSQCPLVARLSFCSANEWPVAIWAACVDHATHFVQGWNVSTTHTELASSLSLTSFD